MTKIRNKTNSLFGFSREEERGIVALSITIIVMLIGLAAILSLVFVFLMGIERARNVGLSEKAYFVAESGIEDALLRIMDADKELPSVFPYTFSVAGGLAEVTVEDLPGNTRKITSDGDSSDRTRRLSTALILAADEVGFHHGAQIGDGGLVMNQASKIIGSVFSNGPIVGSNSPTITGDAFTAGTSTVSGMVIDGNVVAYGIEDSSVSGSATSSDTISTSSIGGNATADSLIDCSGSIVGDAYYMTISNCTVDGDEFPGTEPPSELEPEDMPIDDDKIEEWKQKAEEGGVIDSCDGSNNYEPADGERLGPVRIDCNLVVDGNKEIIIEGFVWVHGNIFLENKAILRLDSSFNTMSSAIIADRPGSPGSQGRVEVRNSAELMGSGTEGSYLMLISMNRSASQDGDNIAIEVGNGGSSSIYYAPHGLIAIQNNIDVVEVTAYQLQLSNNVTIEYEQGLANSQFSAGPQSGYSVVLWREE
ncbi:MAG: hypothetical protein WDZ39_01555 [Candidatus Spechtbacterales bacterium]